MNSTQPRSVVWADVGLVMGFLVLISLPLVLQVFLGRETDIPEEKRAERPPPPLRLNLRTLNQYPPRFEAYFGDHFRLRKSMVRAHHWIKLVMFRDSPSDAVILGKNEWLFYNGIAKNDGDPLADYRGTRPLTEAQCLRFLQAVQARVFWAEQRGAHYMLVVVPNKERVYSEHMPDRFNPLSTNEPLSQLEGRLNRIPNLGFVDLRPVMRDAATRHQVYAKTDTHWNQQGAFLAYEVILRAVQRWCPGVVPHTQDEFVVVRQDNRGGDLAGLLALSDRLIEPSAPVFRPRFTSSSRQVPGHDADNQEWVAGNPELPTAVVFHDSFGNALIPFLKEHFRRIWFRNLCEDFDQALMEEVRPQVVITVMAERNLRVLCTPSATSSP